MGPVERQRSIMRAENRRLRRKLGHVEAMLRTYDAAGHWCVDVNVVREWLTYGDDEEGDDT
jgi:hypothetical protein